MVDQEVIKFFQNYLKESSSVQLKSYSRGREWVIQDIDPTKGSLVFAQEMSIIMLWSFFGSITLKLHFNLPFAQELAATVSGKTPDQITPELACEFVKEFSNFQGGSLRGILEKNDLLSGMSLPFLTRGSDEEMFVKIRDPRSSYRAWILKSGELQLICTAEVCLLETIQIQKIRQTLEKDLEAEKSKKAENDGDVQFF